LFHAKVALYPAPKCLPPCVAVTGSLVSICFRTFRGSTIKKAVQEHGEAPFNMMTTTPADLIDNAEEEIWRNNR
jgi:hypothetical protein